MALPSSCWFLCLPAVRRIPPRQPIDNQKSQRSQLSELCLRGLSLPPDGQTQIVSDGRVSTHARASNPYAPLLPQSPAASGFKHTPCRIRDGRSPSFPRHSHRPVECTLRVSSKRQGFPAQLTPSNSFVHKTCEPETPGVGAQCLNEQT